MPQDAQRAASLGLQDAGTTHLLDRALPEADHENRVLPAHAIAVVEVDPVVGVVRQAATLSLDVLLHGHVLRTEGPQVTITYREPFPRVVLQHDPALGLPACLALTTCGLEHVRVYRL